MVLVLLLKTRDAPGKERSMRKLSSVKKTCTPSAFDSRAGPAAILHSESITKKGEGTLKLYEVNQQLEELLIQLEPDPETGEVPANEEEILEKINTLALKREDILQYLAKLSLNTKAAVQSMKAEEKRLHDRRVRMEQRQEHLIAILDRECGGQKTDLGIATLCYRRSSRVELTDEEAAFAWLQKNGHEECYRIPKPEISKLYVGKLLDAGDKVPGAERVTSTSCYLR